MRRLFVFVYLDVVSRTNDVTLVETYQFNDSANDVFQREPYCAKFRLRDAGLPSLPYYRSCRLYF